MDILKEIADAFLILIRAGVVLRVIYCFIKMGGNEEEMGMYKKRIKNTVIFYVVAESVWLLKDLILGYFV